MVFSSLVLSKPKWSLRNQPNILWQIMEHDIDYFWFNIKDFQLWKIIEFHWTRDHLIFSWIFQANCSAAPLRPNHLFLLDNCHLGWQPCFDSLQRRDWILQKLAVGGTFFVFHQWHWWERSIQVLPLYHCTSLFFVAAYQISSIDFRCLKNWNQSDPGHLGWNMVIWVFDSGPTNTTSRHGPIDIWKHFIEI